MRERGHEEIPIIFRHSTQPKMWYRVQAGAADYVSKPFNKDELDPDKSSDLYRCKKTYSASDGRT